MDSTVTLGWIPISLEDVANRAERFSERCLRTSGHLPGRENPAESLRLSRSSGRPHESSLTLAGSDVAFLPYADRPRVARDSRQMQRCFAT